MVLVHHTTSVAWYAGPTAGSTVGGLLLTATRYGHFGVPLFFVISGYCVTASADVRSLNQEAVRHYFGRRLRRILPPYWSAILLQVLIVVVVDVWLVPGLLSTARPRVVRPDALTASQWLGNLTLTESWRYHGAPLLGDPRRAYLLGQAWTLCYEEQFYVVLGLLLLCGGIRGVFVGAGLVAAVSVALRHLLPDVATAVRGVFIDEHWLMFAAGIAAYRIRNYASRVEAACVLSLLVAGLLYGAAIGDHDVAVACGFATWLGLAHADPSVAWPRAWAPLRWCGVICYSLYLVHVPIVRGVSRLLFDAGCTSSDATVLIVCPLAITAAVAIAWLFHVVVERRFMKPAPR